MTKYTRVSDEVLRANGYDPQLISDDECDGPHVAIRCMGNCPHCGRDGVTYWTVLDLSTGVGGSQDWYGDNGQCEAEETASMLNSAWLAGYQAREDQIPL